MAHLLLISLHALALLFAPVALFATVPLHIIYSALGSNEVPTDQPTPDTHVRCPDCRELIIKDARKCRYCGCALTPQ